MVEAEQRGSEHLLHTASRPAPRRSLKHAVVTALVLVALIAAAAVIGEVAFFVLVVVVVSIALYEMLGGVQQAGYRPNVWVGLTGGMALMIAAFLQRPILVPVVLLATLYAAFAMSLRPTRGARASSDAAWTLFGVGWIAGGGAGAAAILAIDPHGVWLLVTAILLPALDDIGAYFVGTYFGKHKMAPSISPGKSWEGVVGGAPLAVAGGVVAGAALDSLTVLHGAAIGAICAVVGPLGDLVESLFKREVGIKDSGRLLPGHGGLLDRIDAIIVCAPVLYVYLSAVVL